MSTRAPTEQPADLLTRCPAYRLTEEAERRGSREGAGDGVKELQAQGVLARDKVERFPALGQELGLKGVESVEIVEAVTVGPNPIEESLHPKRLGWGCHMASPREGGQTERDKRGSLGCESLDCGVKEQFRRAIGSVLAADNQLDQPPIPSGDGRGDQEADNLSRSLGGEYLSVVESGQDIGLHKKVHRWQSAGSEPFPKAIFQCRAHRLGECRQRRNPNIFISRPG